jgi:hypothetical protein
MESSDDPEIAVDRQSRAVDPMQSDQPLCVAHRPNVISRAAEGLESGLGPCIDRLNQAPPASFSR